MAGLIKAAREKKWRTGGGSKLSGVRQTCKEDGDRRILITVFKLFMSKPIKIIFKGEEYLFIGRGGSLEDGGTIVTKIRDDGDDDAAIYAQLHSNGLVIRSGEIIGTVKEILFIDDESEQIN